ncbi:MAG: PAS domain-containing protein [Fulvimarina manganoxydans]|nr:PAS domain-containing protein [Fulvimarina manganoxydans]
MRYRLLLDSLVDQAIFWVDSRGTVVEWSAGATTLFGYGRDGMLGQDQSILYFEDDRRNGLPDSFLQSAARDGVHRHSGQFRHECGRGIEAEQTLRPVYSADGDFIGYSVVVQARCPDANGCTDFQKVLMERVETLGQLTGGIAHDFNNVLTAVLGNLDLLQTKLPADDLRLARLVKNARSDAHQGAALVKQLSAIGRRRRSIAEDLAIGDLVSDIVELIRTAVPDCISLSVDIAPNLPLVRGDRCQLEAAILNLIFNARDAITEDGSIEIRASEQDLPPDTAGHPLADRHAFVALCVRDTGRGMDAETLRRAGEPFFTTKRPGRGTGLGLATTRDFVEGSDGHFRIDSQPGQGTSVMLWLPVAGSAHERSATSIHRHATALSSQVS